MKKVIQVLILAAFSVCLVMTLSACGSSGDDTQSGSLTDNLASGSIDTAGGSLDYGNNLQWPEEKMAGLPAPQGKITGVLSDDSTGQCTVTFNEMTQQDAESYAAKIKEMGYTNGLNFADADSIMSGGTNANGEGAFFTYNITAKEGSISYTPQEVNGQSSAGSTDMTDAAAWPEGFINNVPELSGKITDVVNDNNQLVTVTLEAVEKADFEAYVTALKQNGYTVEADESSSVEYIYYHAYNADGEWVNACLSISDDGNSATVEMEKPAQ